jgi:N-acetyl-anhydromuramyl-L-alanine amidase AmpD
MAYAIDHAYRKDSHLPLGKGYSLRPGGIKPSAIVIHTTNSPHQNTAFEAEAAYLRDSPDVSAHFLVGKQGQIAQILHPDLAAWHAGNALSGFTNAHSIGIESHVSQGETWTGSQRAALTWLVRWLMSLYTISPAMVDTHRKIALPPGRKSDPEGWPDAAFYTWRAALAQPDTPAPEPIVKRYRIKRVMISQRQEGGAPYAGELAPGEEVVVDKWYTNGYVHLQDQRGFVLLADLEAV